MVWLIPSINPSLLFSVHFEIQHTDVYPCAYNGASYKNWYSFHVTFIFFINWFIIWMLYCGVQNNFFPQFRGYKWLYEFVKRGMWLLCWPILGGWSPVEQVHHLVEWFCLLGEGEVLPSGVAVRSWLSWYSIISISCINYICPCLS